jgi:hypothetical protein
MPGCNSLTKIYPCVRFSSLRVPCQVLKKLPSDTATAHPPRDMYMYIQPQASDIKVDNMVLEEGLRGLPGLKNLPTRNPYCHAVYWKLNSSVFSKA